MKEWMNEWMKEWRNEWMNDSLEDLFYNCVGCCFFWHISTNKIAKMVYSKRVKILPTHTVPTVSSAPLINSNVRYVQGVLSMIQIHWSYDFTMGFCWLWKSMKQIFAKETSEKNGKDAVWVVLQRLLRRGDSILLTHTLRLAFLRQQLMCKAKKMRPCPCFLLFRQEVPVPSFTLALPPAKGRQFTTSKAKYSSIWIGKIQLIT